MPLCLESSYGASWSAGEQESWDRCKQAWAPLCPMAAPHLETLIASRHEQGGCAPESRYRSDCAQASCLSTGAQISDMSRENATPVQACWILLARCPYPHVAGKTNPMTADEWMQERSMKVSATCHVRGRAGAVQAVSLLSWHICIAGQGPIRLCNEGPVGSVYDDAVECFSGS